MSQKLSRRQRIHSRPSTSRFRQRGVAAIIIAGVLVFVVSLLAVLIDAGQLYYAQRDLQKLATISALDAARVLSGCTANGKGLAGSASDVAAAVTASIARNDPDGQITLKTPKKYPQSELGFLSDAGDSANKSGLRRFVAAQAGRDRHDVVRVNLVRKQPALLVPFMSEVADGNLYASATAQQAARGAFLLGSGVLSLDTAKSKLLNPLLQGLLCRNPGSSSCSASIGALDFRGLANADISLGDLATALGVSVQDLSNPLALSTRTVLLSDALNGLASSLSGSVSSQVAANLRALADAAAGNPVSVPLGPLLNIAAGASADVPFVDLLDLILALGESAHADPNGNATPVLLPLGTTNGGIPGVAALNIFMKIGAPPQLGGPGYAGSTTARTADITMQVRLQITVLSSIVNALDPILSLARVLVEIPLNVGPINLGIDINAAQATAYLDTLRCPTPDNQKPAATLSASPTVGSVRLGGFVGNPASAPQIFGSTPLTSITVGPAFVRIGRIPLGTLVLKVAAPADGLGVGNVARRDLPLPVENYQYFSDASGSPPPFFRAVGTYAEPSSDNPQSLPSTGLVSSTLTSLISGINVSQDTSGNNGLIGRLGTALAALLSTTLSSVQALLGPVLTGAGGVLDSLIDPLLASLGVEVGTANVAMTTVSVDQPHLVTTCLSSSTSPGC